MILAVALALAIGIRDARDRVIPNTWTALLAGLGLGFQVVRLVKPGWLPPWEAAVASRADSPATCVLCAAAALAVGVAAELLHRHRTGEAGMGLGDVKYLAAWSLVMGREAIVCFAAACLLGALVALARHERDFALGPWIGLCCVAWLVLCCF